MKNIKSFLGVMLSAVVTLAFFACSNDDVMSVSEEKDFKGWHRAKANFNVSRTAFDADDEGGTRAVSDGWQNGDRVYLLLEDKDGNKVQAYVQYDGTTKNWGQVEYDGYKSSLTCTTPRKVEAYFFDGAYNAKNTNITFTAQTAVYACLDGTYTYPADGDLDVNVSLAPITSRIRFVGTSEINSTIGGIKTYTGFSPITGKLTESESQVSAIVQSDGSTPYLYCVFSDKENPSLIVSNGGSTFQTIFEANTSILQIGKSGYMNLPTESAHRGWKKIIPVTGVSLNKTSLRMEENGKTETLFATILPADASNKELTWTSSNTNVATVSDAGVVTAKSSGTTTITVTSKENAEKKATCAVTVTLLTKSFTVGGVTFTMKLVEPGTFSMGIYNDGYYVTNYHQVTLTNYYYMGETEVTQALWKAVTGYSPTSDGYSWDSTLGLGNEYPAYYISYEDVQSFIIKLNSMTGETFRMPTEAEWEFAAKGGNKSKGYIYSGSNTIDNIAWYKVNAYDGGTSNFGTHKVKTKAANELGLYDMSGNVWEWCSDWYGDYSSGAQINPIGPISGLNRVIRGGCWINDSKPCLSANRNFESPSYRGIGIGFRLCL